MATHDYVIANGTGAAVRSDLNGALAAIVSQNSSATEPSPTYAYQRWADTTAGVMKMRNGANSAWISLYELDGTFLASDISLAAGSAAAPSLFFTGDTNTGLFSPGADTVALATAGSNRLHITSGGLVGMGTSSPSTLLTVQGDGTFRVATGNVGVGLETGSLTGSWYLNDADDSLRWYSSTGGDRFTISSAGNVGIGTTPSNANGGILQLSSGITFPATAVGASDVNTLDDYEEGSWTPTFAPSSGSFTTMTVNVQGARYVKIGQQVTVSAYFFTTAVDATGASGSVSISGLPFATRSTQVVRYGAALGYTAGFNSKPIAAYIDDNSTVIQLLESTTDNDLLDVADLNTTAGNKNFIHITATYFVN